MRALSRSLPVTFPRLVAALSHCASTSLGAALAGACLIGACKVDDAPLFSDAVPLIPAGGRPGNLPVFNGPPPADSAGSSNLGLQDGLGEGAMNPVELRKAPDAGQLGRGELPPAEPDAGVDAGVPLPSCTVDNDCLEGNACTLDSCVDGVCVHDPVEAGSACGSATENACTHADSCDAQGHCLPNDVAADTPCGRTDNTCAADSCDGAGQCVPHDLAVGAACGTSSGCGQPTCAAGAVCEAHDAANGSACPGGSCSVGSCVEGQRVGCPQAVVTAVPFQTDWSSVGLPNLFTGSCESANTPDFAVEFVAPAAGNYRFDATGSDDSVLALSRGACAGAANTELDCNDDINQNNHGSRIQVRLTAGQTVTVYVSEFAEGGGGNGSGTLSITGP